MNYNTLMKTLIHQDSQILYHPEYDDYGILQFFRIDRDELSFSVVKEMIPHKPNTLQKIIIGYKQIYNAFNLWRKRQDANPLVQKLRMNKLWILL